MTDKNLTDELEETEIFRHNGKIIILTESNDNYTVRDGAGRILGLGELPLEFYYDQTLLMFEMGPGKDLSSEGKIIDVQRPRLYRLSGNRQ